MKRKVKLTWQTWNEVCDVAGVGALRDGKPEGCYIDSDGFPSQGLTESGTMGLLIPSSKGLVVAVEGDWIIRKKNGEIKVRKPKRKGKKNGKDNLLQFEKVVYKFDEYDILRAIRQYYNLPDRDGSTSIDHEFIRDDNGKTTLEVTVQFVTKDESKTESK